MSEYNSNNNEKKNKKQLEHINLCITRDFYFYGKFYDELKGITNHIMMR